MRVADDAVVLVISALVAVAAVYGSLLYARRVALLDHPGARSSHAAPTPRGGGLGLLVGITAVAVMAPVRAALATAPQAWLAAGAVALVAAIGWIDDHRSLSAAPRIAVHVVAGVLIGIATAVTIRGRAGFALAPIAAIATLTGAVTVAAVNVVNFMDGIDGLIAATAAIFGVTGALIGTEIGASVAQVALPLALAGAAAGFLVWNWSPARIFMGDVGSGALGALFVTVAVALADRPSTLLLLALPLAPLIVDATWTLVLRARRGERLSDAHRVHLYQRLAAKRSHAPVAAAYAMVALACGLAAIAAVPSNVATRVALTAGILVVLTTAWFTLPPLAGCAPLLPRTSVTRVGGARTGGSL